MELRLANPRGFCAGVDRAISVVDELLGLTQGPVFVRHEIVHNHAVVDRLRRKGAVFVDEVADIPVGAVAVISAHGAPRRVWDEAKARDLRLFDATCPLVTKVQLEVVRHARDARGVIVVGHRDHPEVIGLIGHYDRDRGPEVMVIEDEAEAWSVQPKTPGRLGYVTQTTLGVDETARVVEILRSRFPGIIGPAAPDICYATQNRQQAATELAEACDVVLVVGAPHSSNSVRLRDAAQRGGARAYLIESADAIDTGWLAGCRTLGLTASASAPEHLVQGVVERLRRLSPGLNVLEVGEPERIVFRGPAELRALKAGRSPPIALLSKGTVMETKKATDAVGLEEVVSSVRDLARSARELVEQAGGLAEKELAMLLTVGEEVRERLVSQDGLKHARSQPLLRALRADAHRAVDLGFDAASVAYVTAVDAVESFLDQPRVRNAMQPAAA